MNMLLVVKHLLPTTWDSVCFLVFPEVAAQIAVMSSRNSQDPAWQWEVPWKYKLTTARETKLFHIFSWPLLSLQVVCMSGQDARRSRTTQWLAYVWLDPDSYKRLQAIKLLKVRDRLYLWSFLMIPQGQGLMDSGFCPLECEVGKLNKLRAPNEHRLIDFRSGLLNQILHREVSNRGQGDGREVYTLVWVAVGCDSICAHLTQNFLFAKGWRSCGHPWPGISDGLDTERSGSLYDDACLSKQLFLVESKCMIKRIVNSKGTALYWRTTASAGFVWQVHRGMWHRTDHEGDLTQILPSSR